MDTTEELSKKSAAMKAPVRLWVKGPMPDSMATVQARALGTLATSVRENKGTSIIDIQNADGREIAFWFCEPSDVPFPLGSLLYYSYSPDK